MFLGFANFYRWFIQGFSQIAAPFSSILKISRSIESKIWSGKGKVGVDGSRTGYVGSKLDESKLDGGKVNSGEFKNDEVRKKVPKRSKSRNLSKSTLDFLTSGAKLAFTKLRQTFFKAPILHHFNPERDIRIEIDVSGYAIGEFLS